MVAHGPNTDRVMLPSGHQCTVPHPHSAVQQSFCAGTAGIPATNDAPCCLVSGSCRPGRKVKHDVTCAPLPPASHNLVAPSSNPGGHEV